MTIGNTLIKCFQDTILTPRIVAFVTNEASPLFTMKHEALYKKENLVWYFHILLSTFIEICDYFDDNVAFPMNSNMNVNALLQKWGVVH
jgi:hypothetical protein